MDDPIYAAAHLRDDLDDEISFTDRMKADLLGQATFPEGRICQPGASSIRKRLSCWTTPSTSVNNVGGDVC